MYSAAISITGADSDAALTHTTWARAISRVEPITASHPSQTTLRNESIMCVSGLAERDRISLRPADEISICLPETYWMLACSVSIMITGSTSLAHACV